MPPGSDDHLAGENCDTNQDLAMQSAALMTTFIVSLAPPHLDSEPMEGQQAIRKIPNVPPLSGFIRRFP